MTKKNSSYRKYLDSLDSFQQRYSVIAFPVAAIKKFSDQKVGYLGALITYYGFLSLFPLLLVLTSILDLVSSGYPEVKTKILEYISSYIPVIGDQLQANITGSTQSGPALVIGLLFLVYGAKGGADAFRYAINTLWETSKKDIKKFPLNYLDSLYIIVIGGVGLIASAALSTYASGLGDFVLFKAVSIALSVTVLTLTFYMLYRIAITNKAVDKKDIITSAVLSAVGILLLQLVGGYILNNHVDKLKNLYGTFALVLGLLFWIFLQARVIIFAVSVNVVQVYRRWPISIIADDKTTKSS